MMREFRNYSTYSLQLFYIRIAIIPHKRVTFWTFLFLSCRKYIHTKQPAFDRIKEEDLILFLSYFLAFVLVFIFQSLTLMTVIYQAKPTSKEPSLFLYKFNKLVTYLVLRDPRRNRYASLDFNFFSRMVFEHVTSILLFEKCLSCLHTG